MKLNIEKNWQNQLAEEIDKEYFKDLVYYVQNQYNNKVCYPSENLIFSAFNNCSLDNLKVVIIGQDPYHGPNQANGLCFSVDSSVVNPPSLNNIFKEISADLLDWSKQGVLLLNSVLTVEDGFPGSHSKKGWEKFTDNAIKLISQKKKGLVFMLWGGYAKKKESIIKSNHHLILKSGHPSPLSANRGYWYGNRHFSKCNNYLINKGEKPIQWTQ